jgi:hypothetical protein
MRPRKQVTSAQKRIIIEGYNRGRGFDALNAATGHCRAVVRRILVDAGVEIRGRGRPSKDVA